MAKRLTLIFLVCLGLLAWAIVAGLYVRAESARKNCESVNEVRVALQRIVIRSATIAAKNEDYTPLEKAQAELFYGRAIQDLKLTKC